MICYTFVQLEPDKDKRLIEQIKTKLGVRNAAQLVKINCSHISMWLRGKSRLRMTAMEDILIAISQTEQAEKNNDLFRKKNFCNQTANLRK